MTELIGKKVVIFSDKGGVEGQDIGTLQSIDGIWICVKKSDSEPFYLCVYKVRMIKPFDA